MVDEESKKVIKLLGQLAKNDLLLKHYISARTNPATKQVFLDHVKQLGENFNIQESTLKILLEGDEKTLKNWLKGLKQGPLGLWIIIVPIEPPPPERT